MAILPILWRLSVTGYYTPALTTIMITAIINQNFQLTEVLKIRALTPEVHKIEVFKHHNLSNSLVDVPITKLLFHDTI